MKGRVRKILSLALAVILTVGALYLPAPADTVEAAGDVPEYSVRFEDEDGSVITKAQPGQKIYAIVSAEKADDLTGFTVGLYYDYDMFEADKNPRYSNWSQDFRQYYSDLEDYGYSDDDGNFLTTVSQFGDVSVGDDLPAMATKVVVAGDQSVLIPGVGDADIFQVALTVDEEAEGEYQFSIDRETYHLNGSMNANTIEEEPQLKATITIEREPVPLESFTLSDASLNFDLSTENTTKQLTVASYEPSNTTDTDKEIKWESNTPSVATVDNEGNVTAVGTGDATITATIMNHNDEPITATCDVHVGKSVTSVTLSETSITLAEGQSKELTATVLPDDADNKTVRWSSSNPDVVTVDQTGKITAVAANGTATITAEAGGIKAECSVTVKTSHLTDIALDTEAVTAKMAKGAKQNIGVIFNPDLANVTDEVSNVTWKSSDEKVLTVEAVEGSDHASSAVITAKGNGTAQITAQVESDGKTFTTDPFEIRVYTPVTEISVSPSEIPSVGGTDQFLKGETAKVAVTLNPADADEYDLVWSVDGEGIVSIAPAADGMSCDITALKEGRAVVTVKDKISGKTATTVVTVTEIHIDEVKISIDKTELNKNETIRASAKVGPENTTDDDKTVTWSSSNESVAKVDQTGMITAVGGGKATITATSNANKEVVDTVEITVNVPLDSISFAEGTDDLDIMKGQETGLTVTYNPEDTTVEKTVEWTVSGDEDAVELTDNRNGTATVKALKEGTATITAEVDREQVQRVINVKENSVTDIALSVPDEKTVDLAAGAFDIGLILNLEDESTGTTDDVHVEWTSTEPSVATVSGDTEKVTVTPLTAGTTEIKAHVTTDKGFDETVSCTIIVEIPMTGLKIMKDSEDITDGTFALVKDQEATLSYAADPADTTDTITDVTWESSDPESVSVTTQADDTAVVRTIKESEEPVVITATAKTNRGEYKATVSVSAEEIHIESISLNETSLRLEALESETAQLKVSFQPNNTTDSTVITWSSSNPAVAEIDATGLVTAIGSGSATITATTVNGKTAKCEVYVPTHITGVEADDITLSRGEDKAIEASVIPAESDDEETLAYEIDTTQGNPDAISLEGNVVTGVKAGTAYVKITAVGAYGDVKPSKMIKVTVTEEHLDAVEVGSDSGEKDEDGVYQIRYDADNPKVDVTWPESVTDDVVIIYEVTEGADVVEVDENGYLTFLKEGPATILVTASATDGAGTTRTLEPVKFKLFVDVIELESIEFAKDSKDITIETGKEAELTIVYNPADTTDKVLTWTSSDPSVATVTAGENGTAVVKGLKDGVVTITATSSEGLTATTTVTVKTPVKPADPSAPDGTDDKTDGKTDGSGTTSDKEKDNQAAVQTGDTAHPIVFAVPMILSLAAILYILGRRFKNN